MFRDADTLLNLHPQCATKILRECLCPAPAYISQVCHPQLTRAFLADFDDRVWELWLRILGGVGGKELSCCPAVLARSRLRAFLPCRFDGAGLRSWDRAASFAWFCSMAACSALSDPDFDYARRSLGKSAEDAYEYAMDALGGPSYLEKKQVELIPVGEPDVLRQSCFYKNLFLDNPKFKLQQAFHEISSARARKEFLIQAQEHASKSEKILLRSLQNTEPGTSILSSLFTARLSQKDVRLTKTEFMIGVRQFLCLPPLNISFGPVVDYDCGCQAQVCVNQACPKKGLELDGTGNHGLGCNPGLKAMKATLLEKAIEQVFRAAGGKPTPQPSTVSLLGNHFTKDDVSRLFPGDLNKKQSDDRKKLAMKFLDIIQNIPRGQVRTAELGMLREEFPPPPKPQADGSAGIRFDLRLPMIKPAGNPRELWLDHAIVHESASSYADDVLKFLEASEDNKPENSPAFLKMQGKKARHYEAVIAVAERLSAEHKLSFQPKFLFPVISSFGFMNKDMQQVMKSVSSRFKEDQEGEPERDDGVKPEQLGGRFKVRVRNSLCFALVKGLALAANNQGQKGVIRPV
jgi:hypothetical protein